MSIVSQVMKAYWDYVGAVENVRVRREALANAERLLEVELAAQVADEIIIRDLSDMSGNRLKVPENFKMQDVRDLLAPPKSKTPGKHQGRPQDKYQGRSGKPNKKKHKNGY